MRVMCLHRVPAFVMPLHCIVAVPCPCALLVDEPDGVMDCGLQILQGSSPDSFASVIVIFSETFLTVRQVAR